MHSAIVEGETCNTVQSVCLVTGERDASPACGPELSGEMFRWLENSLARLMGDLKISGSPLRPTPLTTRPASGSPSSSTHIFMACGGGVVV